MSTRPASPGPAKPGPLRLCLTGASGFIGAHLTRHLIRQGHTVRALLRPGSPAPADAPGLTIVRGDLTVPASLTAAVEGMDAVIHLGSVAQASRLALVRRVNVEGTLALARAAREAGVTRFVFVSSVAAQGPSQPDRPPAEAGQESPVDAYGRTKLEAEVALRAGEGPRWTTVIRPALVIGPGDRFTPLLRRALTAPVTPVLTGLELSVLALPDLLHLIDLILGHPSPPFGPFFASHPRICSFETLLDAAERVMGQAPSVRLPVPASAARWLAPVVEQLVRSIGQGTGLLWLRDVGHQLWTCDASTTQATFGWEPACSPEAAVRHALTALPELAAPLMAAPPLG